MLQLQKGGASTQINCLFFYIGDFSLLPYLLNSLPFLLLLSGWILCYTLGNKTILYFVPVSLENHDHCVFYNCCCCCYYYYC